MRRLALGLLLAVLAGCGSDGAATSARTVTRPRSCRSLVGSLARIAPLETMRTQRRELARLTDVHAQVQARFGVDTAAAVDELSASVRAEHESISARRDGRVTASRRLHAQASARYGRGVALARTAAALCP